MIKLRDVRVTYPGGHAALAGINLSLRQGESTVLLGRSGAGKSTLLRCLNLLVTPTSGSIWSVGTGRVTGGRKLREHRRSTGMIFQHHQLIKRHTALGNVLTGRLGYHSALRTLFPLPREEVELALECLNRVGLADKALKRCDQLSGGEHQRVGIAQALAQKPVLILADEPVASLDPVTAEEVMTLLTEICREDGLTLVMSLHQLEIARRFAERIVGLDNGRIVFDGRPDKMTPMVIDMIYGTSREIPEVKNDMAEATKPAKHRPHLTYRGNKHEPEELYSLHR